ncbi:MAG: OmpH family outer membrane protein [Opitutales bacterium]|nr:OmpH family outer membrane protein [Opitutales bacterium]
MKKIISILAAIASYTALNAASIYYVDMSVAYKEFYKAKEAAAQINASAETTKAELQKMDEKRQALAKDLQAIQEKTKNPALTEDAKKQIIQKEAQPKFVELQKLESEMKNIAAQARNRLAESAQRVQQVHFEEISKEIEKLAKEKKADYVLAKQACLFSDAKFDLTAELIKRINASAPKK